ncbi:MAG: pyridoxal 5'-phosphate synthase, partial [Pseudomonadota bacterium]
FESQKGQELLASQKAALNFHWKSLNRQVRVRGEISIVEKDEVDSYYASRPLENRISAWASIQSRPLLKREDLTTRVAEFENKFGANPPCPAHWGGFRLHPVSIEFWQEGEFRLHDRTRFDKSSDGWNIRKLYP